MVGADPGDCSLVRRPAGWCLGTCWLFQTLLATSRGPTEPRASTPRGPRASPSAQASAASSRREGCPGGAEPTVGRPAAAPDAEARPGRPPVPPSHRCARAVHLGTLRDCPLSRGWGVNWVLLEGRSGELGAWSWKGSLCPAWEPDALTCEVSVAVRPGLGRGRLAERVSWVSLRWKLQGRGHRLGALS